MSIGCGEVLVAVTVDHMVCFSITENGITEAL